MALSQPTNIIPSSFTVGVVDAEQDVAQVSWQVNGNSAMTAYQIDFFQNNANSTPISGASTGKISVGIPAGGFYGTDRFGKPKMFTWTADGNKTWKALSSYFINGYQFKFKITMYWKEGTKELSIEQVESNVFVTRTKPSCTVQRADKNFANPVSFPSGSTLPASIGYFVGAYSQEQGAPVRECRWQVATWVDGKEGEILADTGDVDTPTLQFEFNGFFIGNEYAVRCSGKADYQTYGTQDFDSGWANFTVDVQEQGKYVGKFTVACARRENAALLRWENSGTIPPKFEPDGKRPDISDGVVELQTGDSITWDHEVIYNADEGTSIESPMNFPAPWTAVVKIQPRKEVETVTKNVSAGASAMHEFHSATISPIASPDSPPTLQGNVYSASFTFYPSGNYSEIGYTVPLSVRLNGATVLSHTEKKNSDGSLTVTTTSITRPTRATITAFYIGYSHTETIQTQHSIASYSVLGSSARSYDIVQNDRSLEITLYGKRNAAVSINLSINEQKFITQGKIFQIEENGPSIKINDTKLEFYNGETNLGEIDVSTLASSIAAIITPSKVMAIVYQNQNAYGILHSLEVSYPQQNISSVSILGGDAGLNADSVSVFQGDGENVIQLYRENANFEPVWNSETYKLNMSANFDNGVYDGGIGTSTSIGFKIYRQEVGSSVLTPIANVPSTITSLKDFGVRSGRAYSYSLYAYDSNQAFMSGAENDTVVAMTFKNYSLLVCDYDSENDAYHVRKQYLFALNLSAGSEGNNNTPSLNKNFTPYPTRMPDTSNYISGTLQGLIGVIYTVPALVEQVGGFKFTAKPSTLDYFDSVDLERELYDLSVAPYQLFLRDMAGHLRMISTNNQISMTPDIKKRQIPKTISFPWVEIGDASDVTIIQTPDDYGWNNDNQLLDVRLDVDPTTGILSAFYPKPYDGTRFYLTGTQREILGAKTPLGVTPAKIEMSDTAEQPQDGTVTATAKVNIEEGD